MDIDNTNNEQPESAGEVEIEQSLLQQFSCMGTSDKEELVSQLQKIIGPHLNYSTAAFFLDMNNWNLTGAVCSYFDVESSTKLPSMALASDPRASENENIEPNVSFKKAWHVFNNGTESWPPGCYAQCADSNAFSGQMQLVGCLHPGEGTQITVDMLSPSKPGTYQSKWRLCTPTGSYFGDPMWLIVTVVEEGTMDLTDQLSHSHLTDPEFLSNNVPPPFHLPNPFRPPDQTNSNDDPNMC